MGATVSAPRERRNRGLTEKLLSVMHVLEVISLFFAAIAAWGVTRDASVLIWFGLVTLILIVTVPLLKHSWGWIASAAAQLAFASLGLVIGMMFVVAAIFIAMWIWCLTKGRSVDGRSGPATAAR